MITQNTDIKVHTNGVDVKYDLVDAEVYNLAGMLPQRRVVVECRLDSVWLGMEGLEMKESDGTADPTVVCLEVQGGKPVLYVWADVDREAYTHRIDLSGALVTARKDD